MAAASSRGQSIAHDQIKFDVVPVERNRFDDLKTKGDPNLNRAGGAMGQEAIEKTSAASHPRPCTRKRNPGHKDKVDRPEDRNIVLTACGWQNCNDFAAAPAQIRDQWRNLRFVTKRFEDDNYPRLFPNRQLQHAVADL